MEFEKISKGHYKIKACGEFYQVGAHDEKASGFEVYQETDQGLRYYKKFTTLRNVKAHFSKLDKAHKVGPS